jgi:DNA-binding transcriptional LysR family regulator
MELHQIRYFLSVAETLNFTRAAEQLHVSQPALTTAIRKLEEELGAPLFHREGKRVLLSELGQIMRPHLAQALERMESAREAAVNFRLLNKAPMKLGVLGTIGSRRLARFLAAFQREHPGVELGMHEGTPQSLCARLEAGELDLAVLSVECGLDEGYRVEPLYAERYVVIAPPGHRFQQLNAVTLADVSGEAYVDRLACELREMVMAVCGQREVELYATFRSEREDWVQGMVAAGMGFAFAPEFSVVHGGLLTRPLVDPQVSRTIALVHMPGRPFSPPAAAFTRMARGYAWAD